MLKSAHIAGVVLILCLAGNAQAAGTQREISMGRARSIALHYSPGRLISGVHGTGSRGGRYMFEIASRGVVREVDVNARTGRPHTAHVTRVAANTRGLSHLRFHKLDENKRG